MPSVLCRFYFEAFTEGKARSFEGLKGDGYVGGVEESV